MAETSSVSLKNAWVSGVGELKHVLYRVETDHRVAIVTLNRPHVRNAISRRTTYELDRAFAAACADARVHAICLLAAGCDFSSGHDLGSDEQLQELAQPPAYGAGVGGDYEKWSELDVETCLRWRNLPKPLVAGVRGYCIYHGVAVASCADLVVAGDDAKFMPGLVEYNSLPFDAALDVRQAKDVLFLQRFVLAQEARRLGLATRVVPAARLEAETLRLARDIARSDPFYLRMAKRLCNSAAATAGCESHARDALSHWTAYRWHWTERARATRRAGGVDAQTADHGGTRKTLAPVAQALSPGTMRWSLSADDAAAAAPPGATQGARRTMSRL